MRAELVLGGSDREREPYDADQADEDRRDAAEHAVEGGNRSLRMPRKLTVSGERGQRDAEDVEDRLVVHAAPILSLRSRG